MRLIEKIPGTKEGVESVLIKDSWKVSLIKYSEAFDKDNVDFIYTDESSGFAVSLLKGRSLLVTENVKNPSRPLKFDDMVQGVSYYVPQGTGYTIIMDRNCELFAVGSPNDSHLRVKKRNLTEKEKENIKISYQ